MGDALRVAPQDLAEAVDALDIEGLDPHPTKLVSNLPYQVAATVVLRAFEEQPRVERVVAMVQAEVADRMAASPGTKAYGGYTAKLALYAHPTGRFEVGPGNFMPPPHVDSAVIRLDRRVATDPETGVPLTAERIARCCEVIDAAFAQRRKTIRNSMAGSGFDKQALDAAFEQAQIDPRTRAEALQPTDFVRLATALEGE
jgi:16S rRNA (adenine1518-N6/adenine1519-N6)-dimethyltransferase